jgi:hypothetical protein
MVIQFVPQLGQLLGMILISRDEGATNEPQPVGVAKDSVTVPIVEGAVNVNATDAVDVPGQVRTGGQIVPAVTDGTTASCAPAASSIHVGVDFTLTTIVVVSPGRRNCGLHADMQVVQPTGQPASQTGQT